MVISGVMATMATTPKALETTSRPQALHTPMDMGSRKVAVIGEVTARAYESKDGSGPRASLEVTADEIEFLTPKDQFQAQGYQPVNQGYQSNQGGYRQSYPQQGGQNNQRQQSGSWQDNSARNDGMNQNPFSAEDSQGMGFEEISDSDLPF